MAKIIQQLGGEQGLTDAFLAAELGLVGTIIAAYGISAVARLRTEESVATPRPSWPQPHLASGGPPAIGCSPWPGLPG